ncbi:MAG: cobalamin-binding protein [Chlorobiaceae bacterium]|jgi:iron complex transport system substrate-binding protein|nr:cobalamin-binding protein [Chlorobiaceae bacterium]NTV17731.1 cobalamin-binding protein [Chlorobiaceae bacterium]
MRNNFSSNPAVPVFFLLLLFLATGCTKKPNVQKNPAGKPVIVSLAPSLTEMIFAIGAGDQLVGRTSACDWPAAAAKVPVVGAFGRPSLELLASIHPDLVVDVDLADEELGKNIVALGIQRKNIVCKTPDDIPGALRILGKLTGHIREADSLAVVIEKGLAGYRKKNLSRTEKPLLYLEIWDDPYWTGGKGSYTSAMISFAGGHNIGDAVEKEYFEISQEWVIEQNPDIIVCMYMSKEIPAAAAVMKRTGWQHISAVQKKKVFDRFDNNLFLRPGPRVLEGIAVMESLIEKK